MDPEAQAPSVEDQPAPVEAPPEQGTSAEEVESFTDIDPTEKPDGEITPDWLQERYKQMQADYTRKRQADAEAAKQHVEELEFLEALRSDKDTQQAVYEQLMEILSESDDDDDYDDEDPASEASELERTVRELQEAEEQRQAQALATNIVGHIEQLAKDAGVELEEDDLSEVFNRSISGEEANSQTTEAAFKAWHAREQAKRDKWQKAYLASKQAPAQVPPGQSATDKPDLSNREERIRRMAALMNGE